MEYAAKRDTETKIGFLGAMLGLAIQPWETTQILLSKQNPKYIFTFLFFLILVIFGPAAYYFFKLGPEQFHATKAYYYFVIFTLFFVFYLLFFSLYMFVLGIEFSFGQVTAVVVYSLTPIISVFMIYYAFLYHGSGHFGFFQTLANGQYSLPQAFGKIMPYIFIISHFSILFIIAFSMRALTEAQYVSAIIYSIAALLPISAAAFCTGFVADIFNPGSKELVFQIINSVISVWGY